MNKMPQKTDHNVSIKDYMKGQEKQQGKMKTTDNKCSKQITKPLAMSKEGGSTGKTTKLCDEDHTPHKDENANLNLKWDASNRSPLEGNPLKKSKETNKTETNQITEDNPLREISSTEEESRDINHLQQDDTHSSNNSLLQELKEIKETLLNLSTKIETSHQDLSARMIDNKELKDLLTLQNEKLVTLSTENTDLKAQIAHLEKQVLEMQEEMLRLKVDFSGINEGTYESYEQL